VLRWFMGSESLFRIPAVQIQSPAELLAYSILGIIGGFASVALSGAIGNLRPRCKALPRWTQYLQPAVAGVLIGGLAALGAPQVMGAGYEYIDQAMHGQFTWQFLAILAVLKIIATMLSFVSGTPGGMFAPTLFIGAMFGAAVGGAQHALFPHLAWSAGTYALVGMGVLFAGFLRAPMTSVFMVLEVSGNYSIILPVIVANTFAYVISRTLQPVAIFDVLTRQDGLELPSMEEQREESILRVEDAMQAPADPVFDADELIEWISQLGENEMPETALVRMHPFGWSILTRAEMKALAEADKNGLKPSEVFAEHQVPIIHPDQPLDVALRYVDRWPLIPVVSRADFRKLEGVITEHDVLERYRDFAGE
jgi:chloride channel protein, CIC family